MTLPPSLSLSALLRFFLGILLPLIVVGLIAEDVFERQRFAFEAPLLSWVHAHAGPGLTGASVVLNTFGGPVVMGGVFVMIVLVCWFSGRRAQAQFALLGLGGAVGIALGMKLLFNRPRPELWPHLIPEHDAAFPSGHATTAAALITFVVLMLWRTPWRWPAAGVGGVYVLLMGYSRLVLGVHYPTDVLAGWLTGLSLVLGAYQLLRPSLTSSVTDARPVSATSE